MAVPRDTHAIDTHTDRRRTQNTCTHSQNATHMVPTCEHIPETQQQPRDREAGRGRTGCGACLLLSHSFRRLLCEMETNVDRNGRKWEKGQ